MSSRQSRLPPGRERKRESAPGLRSTRRGEIRRGRAKLGGLGNTSHDRQFNLMGSRLRKSGVTVCVTVSSGFMRIQTDENGLAATL